jgi:hypothetical protein
VWRHHPKNLLAWWQLLFLPNLPGALEKTISK